MSLEVKAAAQRGGRSVAPAGLLLVLFALLVAGVRPLSLTADEPAYIAGGYALWQQGQAAFPVLVQRGYPPLLAGLEGALLYLATPDLPITELAGWPDAYDPFAQAFRPYLAPRERTKFVARMPIVLLTVLLGAVVYRWGTALWSPRAGRWALLALAFDPTLLAHGRLATTDAGTVALGTAALCVAWRWTRRPTWRGAVGTGLLLGLTLLAKISGPLWLVVAVGIMLLGIWRTADRKRALTSLLLQTATAIGLSLLVLWAGYGFDWGQAEGLPFAIPAPAHWESARYLTDYTSTFFALGRRKHGTWWWYFPLAFVIKNPLPLLIGSALGLATLARHTEERANLMALLAFPALYGGVAVATGMNIGYRHLLPLHPFLHLIVGGGVARWMGAAAPPRRRWLPALLAMWYMAGTVVISPYELAYFNELIGGPSQGYRYLVDSNLDWGQTRQALADYSATHPEVRTTPPEAPFCPAPGRYAINASYLQGVGLPDPDAYAWFRQREPVGTLHHSVLLYEVPPFEPAWVAQCAHPEVPLDDGDVREGTGQALRNVSFDCTQAWLYPQGGKTPGLYALSYELVSAPRRCPPRLLPCDPRAEDPFVARHLAATRRSFVQTRGRGGFVLYEATPPLATPPPAEAPFAAPVAQRPRDLDAGYRGEPTPGLGDGTLTFLGARAIRDDEALEVETWWRVEAGPIVRPFSIMAHRVTPEGAALGTADGLGVWPLTLRPGDVFVQRHRFAPPPTGAWLRIGAYWGDSGARWPIDGTADADALFLQVAGMGNCVPACSRRNSSALRSRP
jgi:4-amino-4-deoxy-L-arabinose transferase-like glycosyltransferase